jgi:hypothetical protein
MCVSGHHHAPAALPSRKGPAFPTRQVAGWTSELIWTQRLEEKPFVSAEHRTPVVQSVVSRYTDLTNVKE